MTTLDYIDPFGEPFVYDNVAVIADFLAQLHRDVDTGHVAINHDTAGKWQTVWVDAASADWQQVAARLAALKPKSGMWPSIATRREQLVGGRGGAADCAQVIALACDIDVAGPAHKGTGYPPTMADALSLLDDFPLPPTCIVDTGHGLHAWWLLNEPVDAAEASAIVGRFGVTWPELARVRGWTVDNVGTVDRVFRLPGTINTKVPDDPRLVTIIEADFDRRYGLDDLDQFTREPVMPERPKVTPRQHGTALDPRPGDIYNATHRVDDLLVAARCAYSHTSQDGPRHYVAPHRAESRETTGITVYPDPDGDHAVIWPETFAAVLGVPARSSLDAFGLFARLDHGGDFEAAAAALTTVTTPPVEPAERSDDPTGTLLTLVDWATLYAAPEDDDAFVDGLLLPGRWTAIIAPAKGGKSTLALHIATTLATGHDPWTGHSIDPVVVLYVDGEMGERDMRERLIALDLVPADLARLHYTDHPPKCDTIPGSVALVSTATNLAARVVIFDGLNALITGKENDGEPWRALFELTVAPLKRAGIAVLSCDNHGKDPARGGRGSSVKIDKADAIIELARTQDGIKLKVGATRTNGVRDLTLKIVGADGTAPIAYRAALGSWPAGTKEAAALLDRLAIPTAFGRDKVRAALKDARETVGNDVLAAAIRWRNLSVDRSRLNGPDRFSGQDGRNDA